MLLDILYISALSHNCNLSQKTDNLKNMFPNVLEAIESEYIKY